MKKMYKRRGAQEPLVMKKRQAVLNFLEQTNDPDLEKWKYEQDWLATMSSK